MISWLQELGRVGRLGSAVGFLGWLKARDFPEIRAESGWLSMTQSIA